MVKELFLTVLLSAVQIVLFLAGCYYFLVALFSLTVRETKSKSPRLNTFALIVAAHNEETVIGDLVKSLKELEYAKDKYEIFVVADNCTDHTAELARENGAVVWERFDDTRRGKGYAMEFAFEKLFKMENSYEYICIFDADNLVKKDFLVHMNNKINEGYRAVQGYLDSKNPTDNWLTFAYSMWYWLNNRLSQLARGNLDLGCRLGGTGFAVSSDLIKEYGWGATCLAEDTEFTLKLMLNDIKVGWAHDAVVYDEKPLRFDTSIHQRKRWMQGLSEVASRYVKPLAKKGILQKSPSALHMLMNFWGDTLYPLALGFFWVIYILGIFLEKSSGIYSAVCGFWNTPLRLLVLSVFVWGNLVLILAGLYNDQKLDKNIMKNSPGFLIYIISWIPVAVMGFLKRNEKEWFHTPHSKKDN
ncbi:MAG: glycosyltransferase [Clostridia bacterium]|nr:glycosyltransferase [Clostridia bacterium]